MSEASDPTTPEKFLTRRELRERERLARSPLEIAEAADAARLEAESLAADAVIDAAVDMAVADDRIVTPAVATSTDTGTSADTGTGADTGLTPADDELIAANLAEPDLEAPVLVESDRLIAAPAASDAPPAEDVVTESLFTGAIRSTEVPLPSRSQLRADARAASRPGARATRTYRSRATVVVPALAQRPAATRPVSTPRTKSRAGGIAAKGVSFAAMAFVALMAVSTSLPAEALLSSADVQAAAAQSAPRAVTGAAAQSLTLAGGTDTITVQRDGYESKSVAEMAAASGIRMEATFTNDPNGTVQWPFAVGVHIGDHFGHRDCAGCSVNHQGQDFNPGVGAPIQSIADGVVTLAEDGEGSLGVHMIIEHMIDGEKVSSVYAHMIHGSMLFKVGDVVKVGQVIGKTGNTGMSTGPHLHFEIRLGGITGQHVDPLVWLYAHTN